MDNTRSGKTFANSQRIFESDSQDSGRIALSDGLLKLLTRVLTRVCTMLQAIKDRPEARFTIKIRSSGQVEKKVLNYYSVHTVRMVSSMKDDIVFDYTHPRSAGVRDSKFKFKRPGPGEIQTLDSKHWTPKLPSIYRKQRVFPIKMNPFVVLYLHLNR